MSFLQIKLHIAQLDLRPGGDLLGGKRPNALAVDERAVFAAQVFQPPAGAIPAQAHCARKRSPTTPGVSRLGAWGRTAARMRISPSCKSWPPAGTRWPLMKVPLTEGRPLGAPSNSR